MSEARNLIQTDIGNYFFV